MIDSGRPRRVRLPAGACRTRPPSTCCGRSPASTTGASTTTPTSWRRSPTSSTVPPRDRHRRPLPTGPSTGPATGATWPRCCRWRRCAGGTSGCCSHSRAGAWATPPSPPSRRRSSRSGSPGSGRRWRSPSPAPALTRRRSGPRATPDGDDYVLNGEKIFVTAGDRADCVVVWATLDRSLGRAAIKSFVVPGHPGDDRRAARAQAGHPVLRHRCAPPRRLPGPGRQPAREPGDRRPPGLRAVPWPPSTTPDPRWPRWPWAVRGPRST